MQDIHRSFKEDFLKSDMFDLTTGDLSDDLSLDSASLKLPSFDLDDDLEAFNRQEKKYKRQQLECKQLQHDLQLVRIELAERDYQLNSVKLECASKSESLQEKVYELTHQNQILSAKLNSIVAIHDEEDKKKQEQIRLELSRILVRQRELEENNERFMKQEHEIKKELKHIDTLSWTNEEYEFMCKRDEDLLTVREFAALKLHNCSRPLKMKLDDALRQVNSLDEQLKSEKHELTRLRQAYDDEKKTHKVNSLDNQKLYYELADTKSLLQQANFKRDNYDKIKYERDDFERKLADSETRTSKYLATIQVLTTERDDLLRDANQLKQEISLLKQDKDYLQKQYFETDSKHKICEDKLEQTTSLYEEAKRTKEELYEKYIRARDSYKTEYDNKLSDELDELKVKTNAEIEKLRGNTTDFYEREIRVLREARDQALQDKEKLELNEKETNLKYQEAVNEVRLIQTSCEGKVSELKSELKLKLFEIERTQMLGEENVNNYKKVLIENEKLQKKIQIIQNEFYSLQMQNDKRLLELESELNEKRSRLESYEKVENEMDLVIRQVAESSESGNINETEAEKLLLSYGYGSQIMMSAKRRIQQSVHLTKRVLHLEQVNTTLRHELNKERAAVKETEDQLQLAKSVLENTKQPHEYLVRSIQAKETQLKKQHMTIDVMTQKINEMSTDRENLIRKQNEMTSDIEKLIAHNEELFHIRDELKRAGLVSNHSKSYLNHKALTFRNAAPADDQPIPMMFVS